jgi:hypothetical protein
VQILNQTTDPGRFVQFAAFDGPRGSFGCQRPSIFRAMDAG